MAGLKFVHGIVHGFAKCLSMDSPHRQRLTRLVKLQLGHVHSLSLRCFFKRSWADFVWPRSSQVLLNRSRAFWTRASISGHLSYSDESRCTNSSTVTVGICAVSAVQSTSPPNAPSMLFQNSSDLR